jgi:shikimate kinase
MPPDASAACAAGADATPKDQSVFLVGMMGAGKTTIGRQLAKFLGREFVDLDQELEARCGVAVSLIFEIEGEEGFRRRETQMLDECTRRRGIVLATGGGAVIAAANRQCLKQRGTVVYLRASGTELYRRVARDRNRPLLQTTDPRARIDNLLAQRAPLYDDVASITFETGSMPVSRAVRELAAALESLTRQETQ